jgi:hypothetical protein
MAVIVERVFVGDYGGSRRGIELFREELVRPLPFRDNWTKLRIALLWGMGNSAIIPGIVDVGVCSASGRGVLSGVPVNYVGGGYGGGNTRAAAGSIGYYTTGGYATATGEYHWFANHGGTEDHYSRYTTGTNYIGGNSLPQNGFYRRQLTMFDIEKVSSTQCTLTNHSMTAAVVDNDFGSRAVMDACEGSPLGASNFYIPSYSLATSAVEYSDSSGRTETPVTWVESAGPLDALNIAWNQVVVGMTIWEMAVSKYA